MNSFAGEAIVFDDINKISEDLQECAIIKNDNIITIEKIQNLSSQLEITNKLINNCTEQVSIVDEKFNNCMELTKLQEDTITSLFRLAKEQKELCIMEKENCTPSVVETLKNNVSFFGIGVVVGILAIFL